jgi:hypothetical protein
VTIPCTTWVPTAPGVIVGAGGTPGVPGSVCPQGWTEDFDRAQMSTQVFMGRNPPEGVPVLRYDFPSSGSVPPAAGSISMNGTQTGATRLYASSSAAGVDAGVWLAYLHGTCTVTIASLGTDTKSRTYGVTGDVVEHAGYYEVPIFWTGGTDAIPNGAVDVTLSIATEPPLLYEDAYGVGHYGRMPFQRTDLVSTDRDLFGTLADRILEIRGSNSVPRLESVTIDARTGHGFPTHNMNLMSLASPEKPSRYLCRLKVEDRLIFDRMCFATNVRHFISRDEWTLRITLDIAEWAAQP